VKHFAEAGVPIDLFEIGNEIDFGICGQVRKKSGQARQPGIHARKTLAGDDPDHSRGRARCEEGAAGREVHPAPGAVGQYRLHDPILANDDRRRRAARLSRCELFPHVGREGRRAAAGVLRQKIDAIYAAIKKSR